MKGQKMKGNQDKPCKHDGFVYRTTNTTVKDNDGVYCKPCGEQIR